MNVLKGLRAVILTDSLKSGFTPHLDHSTNFASFCSGVKAVADAGYPFEGPIFNKITWPGSHNRESDEVGYLL